ncbi:uncharacterized protein ACDP82_008476 [Pangshura tecta]
MGCGAGSQATTDPALAQRRRGALCCTPGTQPDPHSLGGGTPPAPPTDALCQRCGGHRGCGWVQGLDPIFLLTLLVLGLLLAGEAQTPQPGGLALAVLVPVLVLVLLAAGALLLWFLLARKRQASASRPAKDAGEALYTELQPRDTPDIYCTIQTPEYGAVGRNGPASDWHAAPRAPL